MSITRVLLYSALIALAVSQSCTMSDDQRADCGYMGINQQQCQAKSCCWKPANELMGVPWCFYPSGSNPCEDINYSYDGGASFDSNFYNKMYALYEANINIQSKGGVVASPDKNTPGGSYYFHWMRDAGLTMRAYMELNDMNLSKVQDKMKAYTEFVLRTQSETSPYGDVRINPKFELPNGEVYQGGWCRPQTDGPGLSSGALIMFGNLLLDAGQDSYVYQNLWTKDGSKNGGAIKYDLDWVVSNWQSDGCDLWEEVRSNDFFWNRMAFAYTLGLASKFATRVGDSNSASKYESTKSAIEATLDTHWTGSFMFESQGRQKDGAVIHAFSSFPGKYSWTDSKVAATIKSFGMAFCLEYPINQADNKANIPGVLIGRYPGDSYAGGNPWQLLTAVLAELFYKGASATLNEEVQLDMQARREWTGLFKIAEDAGSLELAEAFLKAGDAILNRLYKYVKNDDGHIAEQIAKNSGAQTSAKDLTWSFANVLSALHYRNTHLQTLADRVAMKKNMNDNMRAKYGRIVGKYSRQESGL